MHVRRYDQRTIFEAVVANVISDYADLSMPPELARLDELLNDEELLLLVHTALGRRAANSRKTGRPSTPSECVLRLVVLKHLNNWTYDMLELEVRGNIMYRQFTRIGWQKVPDAKAMIRLVNTLGAETLRQIHQRVVGIAREQKVVRGQKMRVDTTVVETNVKYPTDSRLLGDAARVMTRQAKTLERTLGARPRFRNRLRSIGHRIFEIALAARGPAEKNEQRRRRLYQRILATTRAVVRDAEELVRRASRKLRKAADDVITAAMTQLQASVRVAGRVIAQTHARVLRGDTHYPDKLLSIFEKDTEAIRKGKASKPTEFGKMVKIQEAENQIVTDYLVEARRLSDTDLLLPSIDIHKRIFGRAPRLIAADAAFHSAANERAAVEAGVGYVAIPNRRSRSEETRKKHRERRFRNAQAWRTGCEGKISVLKRSRGLNRCRNRGPAGMERWVAFGVIAENLWQVAKQTVRR